MSYSARFIQAWKEFNYPLAATIALESPTNIFKMTTPDKWPESFSVWMKEEFDKITDLKQLAAVRQMFLEISKAPRYKEYSKTFLARTDIILFMKAWEDKEYLKAEEILMTSPVLVFDTQIPEGQLTLSVWIEERLGQIEDLEELWDLHNLFLRLNEEPKFFSDLDAFNLGKKIDVLCGPIIIKKAQEVEALEETIEEIDARSVIMEETIISAETVIKEREHEIIQLQRKLDDQLKRLTAVIDIRGVTIGKQNKKIKTLESITDQQSVNLELYAESQEQQENTIRDRNQTIIDLKEVVENQRVLLAEKEQAIAELEKTAEAQAVLLLEKGRVIEALDKTIELQSGMLTSRENSARLREEIVAQVTRDIDQKTAQRTVLETFVFQFLLSPTGYENFPGGNRKSLGNALDTISQDTKWSQSFKARVLGWLLESKKLMANGDRDFITYLSGVHPLMTELLKEYFTGRLEALVKENIALEAEKAARIAERGHHIVLPFVGTLRPFDTTEYAALGEQTDALKPEIAYCQSWVDILPVAPPSPAPLLLSQVPQITRVVEARKAQDPLVAEFAAKLTA